MGSKNGEFREREVSMTRRMTRTRRVNDDKEKKKGEIARKE